MKDHRLALRSGVIVLMKEDELIAAELGEAVFTLDVPADKTWPWSRVYTGVNLPTEASNWQGGEVALTIDIFAKGPGEDECARITALVAERVDGAKPVLQIDGEDALDAIALELEVTSTNVIADIDEPGAYHGIVEVAALTAE